MQFLWPTFLWFLLVTPLMLGAYVLVQRRRRRYAVRYSSLLLVKQALPPGHRYRRHIPPALFLVGLTAMLVALARPQSVVLLPVKQETVILAIDVSGSMRSRDISPNRIEAAKSAAQSFVKDQPQGVRIGVVAFSGTASIVQAPTSDHVAVSNAISQLYLQRSTAIGSGILVSLNAIFGNLYTDTFGGEIATAGPNPTPTPVPQGTHPQATIILLTDGANVQGPSPIEAAQKAADLGIRVFTIGVGDPRAGSAPAVSGPPGGSGGGGPSFGGPGGGRFEVDATALKNIAETTDGAFYLATDATALRDIYRRLNSEITFAAQKTEITAMVTAFAAVLLLVAVALSSLWLGRVV